MISSRINTFLNNFHYLNRKNHRAGCLMFGNKGLTRELEKLAKHLRTDLQALAQNNALSETDKGNEFLRLVSVCFDDVERLRTLHGKPLNPRKHRPYNMIDAKGEEYLSVWVKPYKPARFEKQLAASLNAVDWEIRALREEKLIMPNVMKSFQQQCQVLAWKIRNYLNPDKALVDNRHQPLQHR